MFIIFGLLTVFAIALATAPYIFNNPGYVLIQTAHYNFEMSVVTLSLIILALILSLNIIDLIRRSVCNSVVVCKIWWLQQKKGKQGRKINDALLAIVTHDFSSSGLLWRKAAESLSTDNRETALYYLLAAEAARCNGHTEAAQRYCQQAIALLADASKDKRYILAGELTYVRYLMAAGETAQAIQRITRLLVQWPRHVAVLRLARQLFTDNVHYQPQLLTILPALQKAGVCDSANCEIMSIAIYQQQLQTVTKRGVEDVKQFWQQLPRKMRKNNQLKLTLAKVLIRLGAHDSVKEMIGKAVNKNTYQPDWIALIPLLYSTLQPTMHTLIINQIQWHGETALLQRVLASILCKKGDFAAACDALRDVIALEPIHDDYLQLMTLLMKIGETEEALQVACCGLQFATTHNIYEIEEKITVIEKKNKKE